MASRSLSHARNVQPPEARLPRRIHDAHRQRLLLSAVHRALRWDPALPLIPLRPWPLPLRRLIAQWQEFWSMIWQPRKRCQRRSRPKPKSWLHLHRLLVRKSVRAQKTRRRQSRRRQVRKSYGKIKLSSVGRSVGWVSTTLSVDRTPVGFDNVFYSFPTVSR